MASLTEPAKLLLLVALLSKDHIISNNGKAFLKDLILRRDPRLKPLIEKFENKEANDASFLEQLHELIATEAHALYDDLFADTSLEVGKSLSKSERESKNLSEDKSLIYGEVEFASFYRVLRKINAEPGKTFYDLGSGTGKALFVARLTQDFAKCVGIEILHSLHVQAEKIVARFNSTFKDNLILGQSQYVQVYEGSFLDFDWSDGDVVFANSTCFSDELMMSLSKQAENLKPGSIVVTFTKGMTTQAFELLERKRYRMSWGPATVFIHRRLLPNGQPVGPARLNILPSDSITYDDEISQQYPQPQTSSSSNNDDDEDEDSNYEYDDDIDYNIRDPEDEEDDEEDEDEDEDEEDEEEDEEEEGEVEEEVDDEAEADIKEYTTKQVYESKVSKSSTPLSSPAMNSAFKAHHSPSPASSSVINNKTTPSPAKLSQSPATMRSPGLSSALSPSMSLQKQSNTPQSTNKAPTIFSPSQTSSSAAADFAMLNSPQDTALLMRRRGPKPAPKHETVDSDEGN